MQRCIFPSALALAPPVREPAPAGVGSGSGSGTLSGSAGKEVPGVAGELAAWGTGKFCLCPSRRWSGEARGSQVRCFLHCLYISCRKAATDSLFERPLLVFRVYSASLVAINLPVAKAWYFSRLCTVVYLLES